MLKLTKYSIYIGFWGKTKSGRATLNTSQMHILNFDNFYTFFLFLHFSLKHTAATSAQRQIGSIGIHSSFSSIVRYVRSVNIWIDAKCLVSPKCLSSTKSLTSAKSLTSTKSLPSAKCLPTAKGLALVKFLVIDKHLIDLNLSNMTEISSSNNFSHWKLLKW